VDGGPFRLSRNPIYVALVASLMALAISFDSLWYLLAALTLLLVLDLGVVRAEERYLGERFGAPYAAYRARVRRWL
jgi:protein-S-isoprenylcysteine O-methyltransferase Ste14